MSLQAVVPPLNGADINMDSFQALGLCEEAMHFDVEVTFQGAQPKIFDISTRDTVDKVKTIAHAHFCGNTNLDEYLLGITEKEKLEIEFVKFILAHVRIREELESGELVRVGLYKKGVYTDTSAKEKIDLHTDINFAERRSSVSMGLSKLAVGPKRTSGSAPAVSINNSPILGSKSPKSKSKGKGEEPEVLIVYNSPPSIRERGTTLSSSMGRSSPPLIMLDTKKDKAHKRHHSESVILEDAPSASPPPPPPLVSPTKGASQSSTGLHKFVRNRRTLSVSTDSSPALLSLVEHPHSMSSSALLSPSSIPPQSPEKFFSLPLFSTSIPLSHLFDPAAKGFVVENGSPKTQISSKELKITDTLKSEPWYTQYFFGREHANFVGSDESLGIFVVSVMQDTPQALEDSDVNGEKKEGSVKVRAIVRTKKGDEKKTASMKNTGLFKSKKVSSKGMFQYVCPFLSSSKVTRVKNVDLCTGLKTFEERQLVKSYKFGVLYCKAGQTEEEQMFSNKSGSPDFEEFLDAIGDRITLQGWPNYRAGLDVKAGSTGEKSVYTKYNNFEVMYHVSTLLPYNNIDMQQLERKRHIGNDIVVIVFKEGDQPYDPNCIKSEFNHIFAVVSKIKKPNDSKTYYHVGFATKEGVPHFKPEIPTPSIFEKGELFKDFLLCKLINGENTSYEAPSFKIKIQRTRLALLKELETRYPA